MFARLPIEAADHHANQHYKFGPTELLTLGVSDNGTHVEFSQATDVDVEAARKYGDNIATVELYKCTINNDGHVSEQVHGKGTVSTHLPNHMDNGTINTRVGSVAEQTVSPDAVFTADDIAVLFAKITEVAASMQEFTDQEYKPRGHITDEFGEVYRKANAADASLVTASRLQDSNERTITDPKDGSSVVTQRTSRKGDSVSASITKMNWRGHISEYGANLHTGGYAGGRIENPEGEMTVRKYDRQGREIYQFSTNRAGAADKLAKLVLKHIGRNADEQRKSS
jgi:hypothetical protein